MAMVEHHQCSFLHPCRSFPGLRRDPRCRAVLCLCAFSLPAHAQDRCHLTQGHINIALKHCPDMSSYPRGHSMSRSQDLLYGSQSCHSAGLSVLSVLLPHPFPLHWHKTITSGTALKTKSLAFPLTAESRSVSELEVVYNRGTTALRTAHSRAQRKFQTTSPLQFGSDEPLEQNHVSSDIRGPTQIQQDRLAKESKRGLQRPLKTPCEIYNALVAALYSPHWALGKSGVRQVIHSLTGPFWQPGTQGTLIYAFRAHQSKPEAEQPPVAPAPRKSQSSTNPPFHIPSNSQAGWKPSSGPAERKNRMFSCTRNLRLTQMSSGKW